MDHKFLQQRIPITIIALVSKHMLECMGSRHQHCTEPCAHTHTSLADSVRQQLSKHSLEICYTKVLLATGPVTARAGGYRSKQKLLVTLGQHHPRVSWASSSGNISHKVRGTNDCTDQEKGLGFQQRTAAWFSLSKINFPLHIKPLQWFRVRENEVCSPVWEAAASEAHKSHSIRSFPHEQESWEKPFSWYSTSHVKNVISHH